MESKGLMIFPSDLYLITDRSICRGRPFLEMIEKALAAGVRMLQYREKELPYDSRLATAHQLKSVCSKWGATFIINDDMDLALEVKSDGVHLGQEEVFPGKDKIPLGSQFILGVTVRNLDQAQKAESLGVDYIGLGPIFRTTTKKKAAEPIGYETIRMVHRKVKVPIFAIGGISLKNVAKVIKSGANGVAVVSGILGYPDIGERVHKFYDRIRVAKKELSI